MNGLLKKEFYVLKSNWKTYVFLVLFYAVFSIISGPTYFSCMMLLILLILPITSFSMDELARWDKFAVALPGGRRAVVKSKYQLLFLILAGALVLSFLIGLLAFCFGRGSGSDLSELMTTALACAVLGLFINCLLYPFLFKYGSQKARLYLALGIGFIFAVITIGFILLSSDSGPLGVFQAVSPAIIIVGIVLLLAAAIVISYRVSCRIYDNKEF